MQKKFIYFSVLLLFTACRREKPSTHVQVFPPIYPPSYNNCRIIQIDERAHQGGTDSSFSFYQDSLGRLGIVRTYAGFNLYYDYRLTYDSLGHLVKITSPFNNSSSTLSYTSSGLLNEIDGRQADSVRRRFVYSSSTIPDKCIEYTHISSNNTWDSIEHRYTVQNGNIVMIEAFKGGVSINKANYDYETNILNFDKPLSLISQFVVDLGLFEEVQPFNKNALKKKTPVTPNNYLGGPYYIKYEMDSIKFVRSYISWLNGPTNADTFKRDSRFYEYECK